MKLLLALALLQTGGGDDCPAYLSARGYPAEIATLTRPYIDCMTRPYSPTDADFAGRRASCASIRERQISRVERLLEGRHRRLANDRQRAASNAFDWVDHVVANLPGCETNISISGDGTRLPDAQN